MFELTFKKYGIFQEAIANPFKSSLDASLSQIMGNMMVFLFFTLSKPMFMRSLLLNDIIRDWEKIQLPSEDTSTGLIVSQEMPASAMNDALIPVKKAFFALHLWICVAQLK